MDESVGIIEEQNVSIKDAKELFNTISDSVNGLKEGLDNITQLNEAMDTNRNNVVSKMEDVAAVATETAQPLKRLQHQPLMLSRQCTTLTNLQLSLIILQRLLRRQLISSSYNN